MKKNRIYCMAMALALLGGACSSDDSPNRIPENGDGEVYASISLNFRTRSETDDPGTGKYPSASTDGFEYGKDYENNVTSIIVVLAEKKVEEGVTTYRYITDSGVCNSYEAAGEDNDGTPTTGKNNPVYKMRFSSTDLIEYAGKEVCLFAYCNPSAQLAENVKEKWTDDGVNMQREIQVADNADIWVKSNFLMTNALESTVTLPSVEAMNTMYNKPENPFLLGKVLVERVCARFDFSETTLEEDLGPNKYPIYEYIADTSEGGESVLQGYVTIDGMSLFNEAKNFYYFPRVAATKGTGDEESADMTKVTLLGYETPMNWVVSPENKEFFYSLSTKPRPDSFIYTTLSDIKSNDADNNENWNQDNKFGEYNIWRYVTENTIPTIADQKNGISTGVLFRGYISAEEGTKLEIAIKSGDPIYAHDGIMYGNLTQLKEYVSKYPRSSVSVAFQRDFKVENLDITKSEKEILEYLNGVVTGDLPNSTESLDMYRATDGKYYVYYYYFNRHNDNGNNTVMGPMEFATVRNNVYKLKVTNVNRWGNPGDKPTDPDNPDENPEVYFRVRVEVLPWVVRINNIDL